MTGSDPPTVRPYAPSCDADDLWAAKRAFERGLGAAGDADKEDAYEGKLTDDYRERWLAWVHRCVDDEPGCVLVAERPDAAVEGPPFAGYAFLLPEHLAFVWDAAVVNELWVAAPFRGTGLADALLERALGHARTQDLPLDRVLLDVAAENERARAFYERHGFTPWGELVAREL